MNSEKQNQTIYNELLPGQESFSTFDAADISGIPRGKFKNLMHLGHIPQGHDEKWGRGFKTVFSRIQLYEIELFKRLTVDLKLTNAGAAMISRKFYWGDRSDLIFFPSDQSDVSFIQVDSNEVEKWTFADLVKFKAGIFINLKDIVQSVDAAVNDLKKDRTNG